MKHTATPVKVQDLKEKTFKDTAANQIKQALKDAKKGIFGKGLFAF
jgi:hypothetical protein